MNLTTERASWYNAQVGRGQAHAKAMLTVDVNYRQNVIEGMYGGGDHVMRPVWRSVGGVCAQFSVVQHDRGVLQSKCRNGIWSTVVDGD